MTEALPEPLDFLSAEDILEIAAGVLPEVLVREPGLMESAAARPQSWVFGEEAYPSFELKAAALLHSLANNHPLVDGNKRLAWSATRIFHLMNGTDLDYTVDDAEAMVVGVAAGDLDLDHIAGWFRRHRNQ